MLSFNETLNALIENINVNRMQYHSALIATEQLIGFIKNDGLTEENKEKIEFCDDILNDVECGVYVLRELMADLLQHKEYADGIDLGENNEQ